MQHPNNNMSHTQHKTSGWMQRVLASRALASLTYPHDVDSFLDQFDTTMSVHTVRARIVSVQQQTADSVTVALQPNARWDGFQAGQFVNLTVSIDGVRHTRCFSPASSAHATNAQIELTCKIGSDSVVSRYLATAAAPGDIIHLSRAEGEFALPDRRPQHVLLISAGSGITPVMSMLRTLCDEDFAGHITFVHYARSAAQQLYANQLHAIETAHPNVTILRAYNRSSEGELQGRFSRAQLLGAVPDYAKAQTFLCGPPTLIDAVQTVYEEQGIAEQLHLERFAAVPQAVAVDAGSATGEIRFAHSERLIENDGDTMLNQVEAAGMSPDSGCRMGICHACSCHKLSGRVRDVRTGEISDAGEQDIQLCVSVPVDTVTLDL